MKKTITLTMIVLVNVMLFAQDLRFYYDFEGTDSRLVRQGKVTACEGVSGQGVHFDQQAGPALLVSTDRHTGGHRGKGFSISFWYKLDQQWANRCQFLLGAAQADGKALRNWVVAYLPAAGGRIDFLMRGQDGTKQVTASMGRLANLSPIGWNHVVAVCDGRSIMVSACALDQVRHVPFFRPVELPGRAPAANELPLVLGGRDGKEKSPELLHGALDEFVMVEHALEPEEIDRLFQAGKRGLSATRAWESETIASAKQPRSIIDLNDGKRLPEYLEQELAYGDFELKIKMDRKVWRDGLQVEIGADGFDFNPGDNIVRNYGNFGPADFSKRPLRAQYGATADEFVIRRQGAYLTVEANGMVLYQEEHTRDTLGKIRFAGQRTAVSRVEVQGELRTFPQRQQVLKAGEGGTDFFAIPGLVATKKGTLLAFAEARNTPMGSSDIGSNDVAFKRSTDGGKTWSVYQTLYGLGRGWGLSCNDPTVLLDEQTGQIHLMFTVCRKFFDVFKVIHMTSSDEGITWSQPRDIAPMIARKNYSYIIPGPGHGIQLKRGRYAGRLLYPAWYLEGRGGWRSAGVSLYSDDHGLTWKMGRSMERGGDECQVVEMPDGRVLMFTRLSPKPDGVHHLCYGRAISLDGGDSWSERKPVLSYRAISCQRAFISDGAGRIYSTFPSSGSWGINIPARAGLALVVSDDEGLTWKNMTLLDPNRSSYSDLTWLSNGNLGCVYDQGVMRNNLTLSYLEIPLPSAKMK